MGGLNEVGDGLVSLMANRIATDTSLSIAQVRGMFTVARASRANLKYDIHIMRGLLEDNAKQRLEAAQIPENRNFGTRRPGTLVMVVSQKDELVCMECAALEANSPMPIEVAHAHVPAHPNCRCVIMPYVSPRRRLPVTMTTVSGTSSRRRAGTQPVDMDATLRQLAQNLLNRMATNIKVEITR